MSTAAVAILALVLLVVEIGLTRAMSVLMRRHDAATGYRRSRRQTAWLRPLSGERRGGVAGAAQRISPPERLLAAIVVTAVIALEVILFFSHYTMSAPSSLLGFDVSAG